MRVKRSRFQIFFNLCLYIRTKDWLRHKVEFSRYTSRCSFFGWEMTMRWQRDDTFVSCYGWVGSIDTVPGSTGWSHRRNDCSFHTPPDNISLLTLPLSTIEFLSIPVFLTKILRFIVWHRHCPSFADLRISLEFFQAARLVFDVLYWVQFKRSW